MRLCVVCAGQGRSCCVNRDIVISPGDVDRITSYTGTGDFHELRPAGNPEYLEQDDDPLWQLCTVQLCGRRKVLRHASPGLCWFLGEHGCRLPGEVRPLVCRLHPVQFNAERLTGLSSECPREHLPPGENVLTNLAMDLGLAEQWRQQLYAELRRELRHRPKAA
jgi:Fe-S-cluster containining protein